MKAVFVPLIMGVLGISLASLYVYFICSSGQVLDVKRRDAKTLDVFQHTVLIVIRHMLLMTVRCYSNRI